MTEQFKISHQKVISGKKGKNQPSEVFIKTIWIRGFNLVIVTNQRFIILDRNLGSVVKEYFVT